MRALQEEKAKKREKGLLSMNEKWKSQICRAREELKTYMKDSDLWLLIDKLKINKEDIMTMYFNIQDLTAPSTDIRWRVDTCKLVSKEIINIAYSRRIDEEGEFDEKQERWHLHELICHNCLKSIHGSTVSTISHNKSDHCSMTSSLAAKRADAAAELAVKDANYEMLLEEEKQKESIWELEEQQRKAQAKLKVYNMIRRQNVILLITQTMKGTRKQITCL